MVSELPTRKVVKAMKTYDALVTRDGRWWMIEIPELDGLTQARRLDEVEKMAREYIAVTLDVPMSQVAVSVAGVEVAGQDLLEAKALVEELRRHAKQVEELVADLTREFASALSNASVPVRDVSKVLGVSHQRVSQLVQSAAGTPASSLARLIATAQAERDSDLVVRLKPGQDPVIVEIKNSSKTTASKKPASTRTHAHAPDHAASAARRGVTMATEGKTRRRTIAGRATKRTGTKTS
jgi:predicted RNase H-like HicB family nuclease